MFYTDNQLNLVSRDFEKNVAKKNLVSLSCREFVVHSTLTYALDYFFNFKFFKVLCMGTQWSISSSDTGKGIWFVTTELRFFRFQDEKQDRCVQMLCII